MEDHASLGLSELDLGRAIKKWIRNMKNHEPITRQSPEFCSFCRGVNPPCPSLCLECQQLGDIRHLLFCSNAVPASHPGRSSGKDQMKIHDDLLLSDLETKLGCQFCRIAFDAVQRKWKLLYEGDELHPSEIKYTITGPLWLPGVIDSDTTDPNQHEYKSIFRISCRREPEDDECLRLDLQIQLSYPTTSNGLVGISTWSSPAADIPTLARSWLSRCKVRHKKRRTSPEGVEQSRLPRDLRLIDVESMCIIPSSSLQSFRYLALSYVWGPPNLRAVRLTEANLSELSREGGLREFHLPRTISDAIHLCPLLGFRYLWVDALCIFQGTSGADWHQIRAMDKIYSLAELTIVAATGPDAYSGLPGINETARPDAIQNESRPSTISNRHETSTCSPNFRSTMRSSIWSSRAWTFQEQLLSVRCLIFTEHQVYWQCRSCTIEEEYGLVFELGGKTGPTSETNFIFNPHERQKYEVAVQAYTKRTLSFHSDALNAFEGICNVISEENIRNRHSLSEGGRSVVGIPRTKNHLVRALLWDWVHVASKRPEGGFPHWSWLSWTGPITFPIRHALKLGKTKFAHAYVQLSNVGLVPWSNQISKTDVQNVPGEEEDGQRFTISESNKARSSHWPHSLVIYTSILTAFRLERMQPAHEQNTVFRKLASYQSQDIPFHIPTAIMSNSGQPIGFINLNEAWSHLLDERNDDNLQLNSIVLAKPMGRFKDKHTKFGDYNLLLAILVQRTVENVNLRVGISIILLEAWEAAETAGRVVVLV
jgi:hypothetical protein